MLIKSLKAKSGELLNHQGFMKYFSNTSWLFGEKVLRLSIGVFVGIWVARYLGPQKFGMLNYAQSFVGLFAVTAGLGLDGIVVRELIKNEDRAEELLGTTFYLKLIGAIASIVLLVIAVAFMSNDNYTNTLFFVIASATLFQTFNVIDFYFQSKVLSRYVVYANTISLLISSVIKIILIINKASLLSFAWVILSDSIVLALGFIYFFLKKTQFKTQNFRFRKETALSLLKDSWPLFLSGIVISIYMKIDQVIINQLLGPEEVGQYAAAIRLSEAWYFIPMVIASSLFPAIISAKKQSEELYNSRLQKLYDLMVWMSIIIALPMTFLSNWIVEILYGGQYDEAGSVLMIHIWTGVFVFLGVAFSGYLTAENKTKKAFYRTLLGAVLNVILNYVLIPIYGICGSAIATLIGQFFANYVYDIFDKDLYQQLKMKTKSFFPIHILKMYK
ncbi:O-antigen/teichoic acid export membrane protein [Flavobacterium nitrogenifigens]|uniref:O-antigen/teichoic acid export membrane protein n=2 Tax=Flavobacterium TaxID=237 RepID=A0A7W7J0K9_9FLAO|nr:MULTISPECIES: flippase [Flavobacterium]MBB4803683.1 O-antigen/teichoic acid export membrane protein [Flavobacterium nitrogenifigens]MBB6388512.1 O-antigen/teichoic acid export membrane protein [Flavobacterium notoginsengisoli]